MHIKRLLVVTALTTTPLICATLNPAGASISQPISNPPSETIDSVDPGRPEYRVWGNRLVYGVGRYNRDAQLYWVDRDIGHRGPAIANAIWHWNNTSRTINIRTPVNYKHTYTKKKARLEFTGKKVADDTWAKTLFYKNKRAFKPWEKKQNWVWCKVTIASDINQARNSVEAIMSHEIGHCFGLAHFDDKRVIMHSNIGQQRTNRPKAGDALGVNSLYE